MCVRRPWGSEGEPQSQCVAGPCFLPWAVRKEGCRSHYLPSSHFHLQDMQAGGQGSPSLSGKQEVSSNAGKGHPLPAPEAPWAWAPCTSACSSVVLPSPRLARAPDSPFLAEGHPSLSSAVLSMFCSHPAAPFQTSHTFSGRRPPGTGHGCVRESPSQHFSALHARAAPRPSRPTPKGQAACLPPRPLQVASPGRHPLAGLTDRSLAECMPRAQRCLLHLGR